MTSVFLSYSREDRAKAQQVVAALEAGGVSVWWDGLIEGGERFSHATEAALDGADVVVVLWSKTSVKSHWVHDEATRGRDRGRLVPASIDGAAPPLGFGQFQALDLAKWKGKAGAPEIDALLRAIAVAAGQPEADRPTFKSGTASPNRRVLLIGGGATAALATGGVAAWQLGLIASKGEANSVAVLPFRNLSGDPAQDYFAEGLAAEIRGALARNPLLKVASSASSDVFSDRRSTAPEIGQKLAVAFILDGSVRRSTDKVKISSELIDGKSGLVTWSRTVESDLTAALDAQRKIAEAVGQVLTAQVQGLGVSTGVLSREYGETNSTAAFEAYLQARSLFLNADNTAAPLAKLDLALQIDPDYGAALAEQSRMLTHSARDFESLSEKRNQYRKAIKAGQRAVRVAPKLAIGYSQLGFALTYGKLSVAEARIPYERSKELGWNDAHVVVSFADYLSTIGQHAAAIETCIRAQNIDPLNKKYSGTMASILFHARKFDLYLIEMNKFINETKTNIDMEIIKSILHVYNNNYKEAEIIINKIKQDSSTFSLRAIIEYNKGNKEISESFLNRSIDGMGGERYFNIGYIRAGQGQINLALDAFEKAYALGDGALIDFYNNPFLDGMRKTARFKALYGKMGFSV